MKLSSGLCRTIICLVALVLLLKQGEAIRCSVCETGPGTGGSSCLLRPPPSQLCDDRLGYCIEVAKYTTSGILDSFTRSCSPFLLPGSCIKGIDKSTGQPAHICYTTCATDGCNSSSSLHHVLDLLRRKRKWDILVPAGSTWVSAVSTWVSAGRTWVSACRNWVSADHAWIQPITPGSQQITAAVRLCSVQCNVNFVYIVLWLSCSSVNSWHS